MNKFRVIWVITDCNGKPHPQWPEPIGFTLAASQDPACEKMARMIVCRLETEGGCVRVYKTYSDDIFRLVAIYSYPSIELATTEVFDESAILAIGEDPHV